MKTREIVKSAQKKLAACLLDLAIIRDNVEVIGDDTDYDTIDLSMHLDEGLVRLGFVLADFTSWLNEDEIPEDRKS